MPDWGSRDQWLEGWCPGVNCVCLLWGGLATTTALINYVFMNLCARIPSSEIRETRLIIEWLFGTLLLRSTNGMDLRISSTLHHLHLEMNPYYSSRKHFHPTIYLASEIYWGWGSFKGLPTKTRLRPHRDFLWIRGLITNRVTFHPWERSW